MFRLLLLAIFLTATARADEQRWLLVFNTSAAMKKRLPAVEASVKTLLESSANGKISPGDGLAVWVFDETLRTRQFPNLEWNPQQSASVTSNLITFLRSQKFSGNTKFDALKTNINWVVAHSERLTILIFCDGADAIHWTPYDEGINNTFAQTAAERKKSQQPFVLLLRSQQGKFIGATVNYPPGALNVPTFPLLPRELKPAITNTPPPAPPAPPQPVVTAAPPLIIVGTHVSTNADDVPKEVSPATNPLVITVPKTNPPTPPPVVKVAPPTLTPTNSPAPVAVATNVAIVTNAIPATTNERQPTHSSVLSIFAVACLILLAGIVGLLFFGRPRPPRGSLITSSMQDEVRPPDKK